MREAMSLYAGWVLKKAASAAKAAAMGFPSMTSFWLRLTTPTNPFFSCGKTGKGRQPPPRVRHQSGAMSDHCCALTSMTRPMRVSKASVPSSMRSSLVSTPTVRSPCGSTSSANFNASLGRARAMIMVREEDHDEGMTAYLVAVSEFAGVMARIMALGDLM